MAGAHNFSIVRDGERKKKERRKREGRRDCGDNRGRQKGQYVKKGGRGGGAVTRTRVQ